MDTPEEVIRRNAVALTALAQTGLAYGHDEFDRERYRDVHNAAAELLDLVTDHSVPTTLDRHTLPDEGYATPKVDVRAAVFDADDRVLLIQERADQRWTLPGGWCDVGESPGEAACREVREESGYPVRASRLVAVLDRDRQGHWPPMSTHVYKLFFLCDRTEEPPTEAQPLETLDVGWFPLDALPELSIGRTTEHELHLLHAARHDPTRPTVFD